MELAMDLIDTPFEQIKPVDYDDVITELQKVKNELTDLAEKRADLLLKAEAKIEKMNIFIKPLIEVRKSYHQWLKPLEEIYFKKLMELKNDNQSKVAVATGLNRGTIRKKLKQYNLI